MRDLILRLDAERCADGVELVRLDNPPAVGSPQHGEAGPVWFSWRSNRHKRVVREAVDLADPLVVRFVNADDDDERVKFISLFGLPMGVLHGPSDTGLPAEPREFVLGEQRELRRLLQDAGSGDLVRADRAASRALYPVRVDMRLSRSHGRTAFTVQTLTAFMRMEIAAIVENGAYVGSCKCCGDFFVYGKGTRQRNTRTYCNDHCRVGADRARKHKGG
jgi:hypothetical protein